MRAEPADEQIFNHLNRWDDEMDQQEYDEHQLADLTEFKLEEFKSLKGEDYQKMVSDFSCEFDSGDLMVELMASSEFSFNALQFARKYEQKYQAWLAEQAAYLAREELGL